MRRRRENESKCVSDCGGVSVGDEASVSNLQGEGV